MKHHSTSQAFSSGLTHEDEIFELSTLHESAASHWSQIEAQHLLWKDAEMILSQEKDLLMKQIAPWDYFKRADIIWVFLLSLGLCVDFILSHLLSNVHRPIGVLIEGLILLCAIAWNAYLYYWESKSTLMEMPQRLELILETIKKAKIHYNNDVKIPFTIPTVSLCRVVRDGTVIYSPFNLLVKDDLLQMSLGEIAPCKMKWIAPANTKKELILEKGELLNPRLFEMNESFNIQGPIYFRALESPIKSCLEASLHHSRPEAVIVSQIKVLQKVFTHWIIWIVSFAALLINIIRIVTLGVSIERTLQYYEMLVNLTLLAILPLLPMVLPIFFFIARSFGNAHILALYDALQASATEFEDKEDVDEFDVAPPPTKNLSVDKWLVWKRFKNQIMDMDVSFLARTTGLVESLANTTVICAIDREGTISSPIPLMERLFFIGESEEPIVLDIIEDKTMPFGVKFEDKDWEKYIGFLKPLALNQILTTDCIERYGRRRNENHRRYNSMLKFGHVKPSRQTCLCQICREIGFTEESIASFESQMKLHIFAPSHPFLDELDDYHFEIPSIFCHLFYETNSESFQLFSEGNFDLMMESCPDYWNGTGIGTMNENVEKRIAEFYQNSILSDMQVMAYAYRPIPKETYLNANIESTIDPIYIELKQPVRPILVDGAQTDSPAKEQDDIEDLNLKGSIRVKLPNRHLAVSNIDSQVQESLQGNQFLEEAFKGQTFLGLASFSFQPKHNLVNFIEDLGLAGVRFVHFSNAPQREAKAYAERLGLETDWNSCILLSKENGKSHGYLDYHDMKAQLPQGIENIRKHIENVDDVPLHVSLFAECSPASTKEMIQIFQEYGEVVCCIGSSLNDFNVETFAMADISIAIHPFLSLKTKSLNASNVSSIALGSAINTAPCALSLNLDTSLYSITQLIREARTLAQNARQAFSFYIACQLAMSSIVLLSYCFLLPPIFQGYQIIWTCWILMPCLSLSFFFSPYDAEIMTHMPVKNSGHLKDKWRFTVYYLARILVPVVACLILFILYSISFIEFTYKISSILDSLIDHVTLALNRFDVVPWDQWTQEQQSALLLAQNVTLFHFVYYMSLSFFIVKFLTNLVVLSATYLHRTEPLIHASPARNFYWIFSALIVLVLQVTFFAISIQNSHYGLGSISFWLYIPSLLGVPMVMIPIQEFVKMHDKKEWSRFQKRSKLEFNTKL